MTIQKCVHHRLDNSHVNQLVAASAPAPRRVASGKRRAAPWCCNGVSAGCAARCCDYRDTRGPAGARAPPVPARPVHAGVLARPAAGGRVRGHHGRAGAVLGVVGSRRGVRRRHRHARVGVPGAAVRGRVLCGRPGGGAQAGQ